jgi:hypothetical protein
MQAMDFKSMPPRSQNLQTESSRRRFGEKEKRRIYPIISSTPDKPGCKQWIPNPCYHEARIYPLTPAVGDGEKGTHVKPTLQIIKGLSKLEKHPIRIAKIHRNEKCPQSSLGKL